MAGNTTSRALYIDLRMPISLNVTGSFFTGSGVDTGVDERASA